MHAGEQTCQPGFGCAACVASVCEVDIVRECDGPMTLIIVRLGTRILL
jgi:hypothetical protein